jgi:hypothetical protein
VLQELAAKQKSAKQASGGLVLPDYDLKTVTKNMEDLELEGKKAAPFKLYSKDEEWTDRIMIPEILTGDAKPTKPSDYKSAWHAFQHVSTPIVKLGIAEGVLNATDVGIAGYNAFYYSMFKLKEDTKGHPELLQDYVRPLNPKTSKFAGSGWAKIFREEFPAHASKTAQVKALKSAVPSGKDSWNAMSSAKTGVVVTPSKGNKRG